MRDNPASASSHNHPFIHMRRTGPMKPNALVGVPYNDFIQGIFVNRVMLSRVALPYLIRCGMIRNRPSLIGGLILLLSVILCVVSAYNWPLEATVVLTVLVVVALQSELFILQKTAWVELAGAGRFSKSELPKVYERLVADNYLHAESWEDAPEDQTPA